MSDEADVRMSAFNDGMYNRGYGYGSSPYGYAYSWEDMKPWYLSRSIWMAFFSFALYIPKSLGWIDWSAELLIQIQGFLVTLAIVFARIGNKRLVGRRTFQRAREEAEKKAYRG